MIASAEPMPVRDRFGGAADRRATWRREGLPDPAEVIERGIKTRESLDWLAARDPKTPAPELHIDDPALRQAADEAERQEHRARVNRLREGFLDRAEKAQRDFSTARDWRELEQER